MFMRKDASPAISITRESGFAICAPTAAGIPKPIVPKPPDVIHLFGFENL